MLQSVFILMFIVFGAYFLTILTIFLHNYLVLKTCETIDDELNYLSARLERYTLVQQGIPTQKEMAEMKKQYAIPVNFIYYLTSEQTLYLFDRNRKLFAVCDKIKRKTYLTNLTRMITIIEKFESQFHKIKYPVR